LQIKLSAQRAAARSPEARFNVLFNNQARDQAVANALVLKAELTPDAPRRTSVLDPKLCRSARICGA
jgi:hypothetical protein